MESHGNAFFIDYCFDFKAYKMHDPINENIIVSINVLFNENIMGQ